MAKFENNPNVHDGNDVKNYISQINVGETLYDIATHHSIKFVEGDEETTWNGLSDLKVVIPTIQDIVQTPVEFIGTVNASGKVMDGTKEITTFEKGNLVFIVDNCKFGNAICESGDMAIYSGTESGWMVIAGENQVYLVKDNNPENPATGNVDATITGTQTTVLNVEGRNLSLKIDYNDIRTNNPLNLAYDGSSTTSVSTQVSLDKEYIYLTKASDSTIITTSSSISIPTSLSNGAVAFSYTEGGTDVVTDVAIGTFTPGSFPTITKNSTSTSLTVTGGVLTSTSNGSDFITEVSIVKDLFFEKATSGDYLIETISSVTTSTSGNQEFFSGVNSATTNASAADIVISGYYSPKLNDSDVKSYITNFDSGVTSLLTSKKTDGSIKIGSKENPNVITGISTTVSSSGDFVCDVDVSAEETTAATATVSGNILVFGSTTVATPSLSATCLYKKLVSEQLSYTAPTFASTSFGLKSFEQTNTVGYNFTKNSETVTTVSTSKWTIGDSALDIKEGGYILSPISVTVPKNTFATGLKDDGTLPSLGNSTITKKGLSASVGTSLSASAQTINGLLSSNITIPGAYSIASTSVEPTASASDYITVAKADTYSTSGTIDLSGFVTSVDYLNPKTQQ